MKKILFDKLICAARNLRSRALFKSLETYCSGRVLDIGGWDFFKNIKSNPKIKFTKWVNLEPDANRLFHDADTRYAVAVGDGCDMKFENNSFDTAVNIQVLEHVFEPIKMVQEIARVLKPSGYAIFLIPQTSVLHHAPNHYYNFTKFWIRKALHLNGLEIVELRPLGGRWTTTASHLVHFFFQSFRAPTYSTQDDKRNILFYLLYPLMVAYALISIPICLFLGLGDLTEEPNNWLVIAKKTDENYFYN